MGFLRPPRSASVFFIIDGPKIEAQSVLLAATLRHHNGPDLVIDAYTPASNAPNILRNTRRILRTLGVSIHTIDTDDFWTTPYPIGNKILAACEPRDAEISFFLDSDIVATAPMEFSELASPGAVSAVVSDYAARLDDPEAWPRLYRHFGLEPPEERVQLLRGRRLTFFPYVNSGVVGFETDGEFASTWLDVALEIDKLTADDAEFPRINIDQIALPIAARKLGMTLRLLPSEYNCNIMRRDAPETLRPRLAHYHRFQDLAASRYGKASLEILNASVPPLLLDRYLKRFRDDLAPLHTLARQAIGSDPVA
ncbi:MAG: hypothetical protein KJO78_04035 [Alphaproteobacteria bacterium]|nr:hypothetical protein [Alphaproteobacteria bacterium]